MFDDDEPPKFTGAHTHEWEFFGSPWGVIIGVTKCQICGETAESTDFPQMIEREVIYD